MTELEKLKTASELIRDMTDGQLQIATSIGNHIFVRSSDDAYIGLNMMIHSAHYKKVAQTVMYLPHFIGWVVVYASDVSATA